MKSKKIITAFIIFVFLAVVTVGFFSAFTLKRVDVDFTVSEYGKPSSILLEEELCSFKGQSLIFLKEDKVLSVIEKYPYFEAISVKKSYPNGLNVTVKERRETYKIFDGADYYVIDDKGVILNKNDNFASNLVEITGVVLSMPTVGTTATCTQTDCSELLSLVYGMSDIVDSTDSVEKIELKSMDDSNLRERWRVIFHMRTGVKIAIYDAFDEGLAKMQTALSKFEDITDYQKCYNYVVAYKQDGKVVAIYTENEF